MKVFVAGATGAIGQYLIPQLVARGHSVTASTRRQDKFDRLRTLGAKPIIMDGLNADAVTGLIADVEPEVIVHQMTALAGKANLRRFDSWFAVTNRLRTVGTQNLLAAGEATGVAKFVVQSYTGWSNERTGGSVKNEADPLDPDPAKNQRVSMAGLRYLDSIVATSAFQAIVLRYGNFYGPGASEEMVRLVRKRQLPVIGNGAGVWSWIHLDDAAAATVAAVERGTRGVYNIVDDEPAPVSQWLPRFAEAVGAKSPLRVPVWLGRLAGGEVAVRWMTEARGSSNNRAKRELGWSPTWSTWRDGFRDALTEVETQVR